MFDTIRLETPLLCPGCGREETTVQTHHFGETLDTSAGPGRPVLTFKWEAEGNGDAGGRSLVLHPVHPAIETVANRMKNGRGRPFPQGVMLTDPLSLEGLYTKTLI